jgi:integrase/recombinase XerD
MQPQVRFGIQIKSYKDIQKKSFSGQVHELKEPILKMHAGWSPNSQMHLKYEHWFGNESSASILEAYGIIASGQQIDQLRPKQCPNCTESNKVDSKFCAKCRMVLSYDAYTESLEKQQQEKSDIDDICKEIDNIKQIMRLEQKQ